MPSGKPRIVLDGSDETTWEQRFTYVVNLFCGATPPLDMIAGWFTDPDDERLQRWVACHMRRGAQWAQAIEIIDAAARLADTPAETDTPHGHIAGPHHPRTARFGARGDVDGTGVTVDLSTGDAFYD